MATSLFPIVPRHGNRCLLAVNRIRFDPNAFNYSASSAASRTGRFASTAVLGAISIRLLALFDL